MTIRVADLEHEDQYKWWFKVMFLQKIGEATEHRLYIGTRVKIMYKKCFLKYEPLITVRR